MKTKTKKPKILYVEDDIYLSFVTKDNLEMKGYEIVCCEDGEQALAAFSKNDFDLCIIDVMLPKLDGFSLAKAIRAENENIPILFLSAKSMKEDRIMGLEIGGDDYITKPFSIEELVLKIEVFLKRSNAIPLKTHEKIIEIGKYSFDFNNLELIESDISQRLTLREAELLSLFCKNINKVLTKEDILNNIWNNDSYFLSRSLDVFVSRLRKLLKKDKRLKIENIHGVGFILKVNV